MGENMNVTGNWYIGKDRADTGIIMSVFSKRSPRFLEIEEHVMIKIVKIDIKN